MTEPYDLAEDLTPFDPEPDAEPDAEPDLGPIDYLGVVKSLTVAEKNTARRRLGCDEIDLLRVGANQMAAVAWKVRMQRDGVSRWDVATMNDAELLAVIGLTEDQYAAQLRHLAPSEDDEEGLPG